MLLGFRYGTRREGIIAPESGTAALKRPYEGHSVPVIYQVQPNYQALPRFKMMCVDVPPPPPTPRALVAINFPPLNVLAQRVVGPRT